MIQPLFLVLSAFRPQRTIDGVEDLLKKHEAFEKSAAAQEERFMALERPTTVSLLFPLTRVFLRLSL